MKSHYISERTHQVKVEAHSPLPQRNTHKKTQKTKAKSATMTNIISRNGCRETQITT